MYAPEARGGAGHLNEHPIRGGGGVGPAFLSCGGGQCLLSGFPITWDDQGQVGFGVGKRGFRSVREMDWEEAVDEKALNHLQPTFTLAPASQWRGSHSLVLHELIELLERLSCPDSSDSAGAELYSRNLSRTHARVHTHTDTPYHTTHTSSEFCAPAGQNSSPTHVPVSLPRPTWGADLTQVRMVRSSKSVFSVCWWAAPLLTA